MAQFIMKHRRGTATEWANSDIIPLAGELVVEIDEENNLHKLKIGDGEHKYQDLKYLQAGDEIVTQILEQELPQVLAEARPHIITVTLDFDDWVQITDSEDPNVGHYKQSVVIEGVDECCRLDLQPDVNMLAEFKKLGVIFTTENKDGAITVYSVGVAPTKTYIMQATLVETELKVDCDRILGIPVGASNELNDETIFIWDCGTAPIETI